MDNVGEIYNKSVEKLQAGLKKYIYDIVAGVIIIAILAASLHVFGLADLSDPDQLSVFLMDWLPYLAAAILLNSDLYQKGVFVGKTIKSYVTTMDAYGKTVNAFTGHQLDTLPDFCEEYNDKALTRLQREILKPEGISYESFDVTLRTMSDDDIIKKYGKTTLNLVKKAKRAKIKGINVNTLLSSLDIKDATDLGANETTMLKSHTTWSTIRYIFTTMLMSLIVINDVSTWGWGVLIVVVFKIAFLVGGTLMSYFKGYNNMTVNLVAHIARKVDVLKEFLDWYNKKFNNVKIKEK